MTEDLAARLARVQHLIVLDRTDQAAQELAAVSAAHPDEPRVHMLWSVVHQARQEPERAIESVGRVLAVAPDHAPAHLLLGVVLRQAGDDRGAEEALRRAAALDPEDPTPHEILAQLLSDARRHREAVQAGRTAVELGPGDPDAHFALGYAAHDTQRALAVEAYEAALALDPQHVMAQHNLVGLRSRVSAGVRAQEYARVLARSPGSRLPLRSLDELAATALHRFHLALLVTLFAVVGLGAGVPRPFGGLLALSAVALTVWFGWRRLRPIVSANRAGTVAWFSGYRKRDPWGALWLVLLGLVVVVYLVSATSAVVVGEEGAWSAVGAVFLIVPAGLLSWVRRFVQGRRIRRERFE